MRKLMLLAMLISGSAFAAEKPARTVFVLDASNSMLSKFDAARKQVYAGVRELPENAEFNVLVASEGKAIALSNSDIKKTDSALEKVDDFLSKVAPHGISDLTPAIQSAQKLATVVWLVSDGDTDAIEKTVAKIKRVNVQKIPINTVLHFAGESFPNQHFLWLIAKESGGMCLDAEGKPATIDKPKPPETGPSIFKEKH